MLVSYALLVWSWANIRSCYCLVPLTSFQRASNYGKVKIGNRFESVLCSAKLSPRVTLKVL